MDSDVEGAQGAQPQEAGAERIRLVRGGAILLEDEGFRLIEPRGLKRSPVHAYDAISHVYRTGRVLLIGTRGALLSIHTRDFVDPEEGPEVARQALLDRVAARPGADAQLESMAAVERLGDRDGPVWMIWAVVALCLVGTGLQLADPMVEQVGAFLPDLFHRGEFWRAITAHFLHDLSVMPAPLRPILPMFTFLPIHLVVNVAGLLILGHLVERPLGPTRTAIVLATSAAGAIVGILLYGHLIVVGASGIVAGLAGAMLAMELHCASALPAFWRLPRRLFLMVLLIQFCIIDPLLGDFLAGGAHLGGFVGGYVATWALGSPSASLAATPASLRFGSLCAGALLLVGVFGAMPLARHDMRALERHAGRLFDTPEAIHLFRHDNAAAWLIATEGGATDRGLDLAIALADRAVTNTGRLAPGILDTLAEALFQRGDRLGALFAIEEAIRLDPDEPYYYEQRRRFVGDRAANDRPPPPGSVRPEPPPDGPPPAPVFDPDAPRLTV